MTKWGQEHSNPYKMLPKQTNLIQAGNMWMLIAKYTGKQG